MLPETQFVVRVFPSPNKDWKNVKIDLDQKLIHLRSLEDMKRGNKIYWQFKADEIFINVFQEEFYKKIFAENLLQRVMKGTDLVILCFGSSGTGKTYSAFGLYNRYEYRGIAPRLLEDLFNLKETNCSSFNMDILLTYVEIIGKNIHNLLLKGKPHTLKTGSKTYSASQGVLLDNVCHGMKLLFDGDERRNYENENSHCATSILTFEITCVSLLVNNPYNTRATIHLIDTAGTDYGSNAIKSIKCHVDANLAKSALNTLCSWANCYSETKITSSQRGSTMALYLGSSLMNGFTRFLGHIKTSDEDLSHSMSTLLFGTRLRNLPSPLLVRAKKKNLDLIVKGLQEQISEMKSNSTVQKLINGTFMPETISQEQMNYIMREIKFFLISLTSDTCLLAKAHPSILLFGLKETYIRDIQEIKDIYKKRLEEKDEYILSIELEKSRTKKFSNKPGRISLQNKKTSSSSSVNYSHVQVETEVHKTEPVYNKIDFETESSGKENYIKTLSEFMAKSPQIKADIKLYETAIEESFKNKCKLQSRLSDLKYEINLLRIELQKEEWNIFNKNLVAKMCDRKENFLKKSLEQENIEFSVDAKVEEFNSLRAILLTEHHKYIASQMLLNETKLNAEKHYNEYIKNMYSNSLILPPQEKQGTNNEIEQTNLKKEDLPKVGTKSKKCFSKLQKRPIKKIKII